MSTSGKKGGGSSSSSFKPLTLKDLNHPANSEKIKYTPQIYENMRKIIGASSSSKEDKDNRIQYTYSIQNLHKNFDSFVNNVLEIYNKRANGSLPHNFSFNPKVNRDNWQQKTKKDTEGYDLSDDGLRVYGSNAFSHHLNDIAMKSAPTVWNDLLNKFHNSFNYAKENDKVDLWVKEGGLGCFEGIITDLSDWMSNAIHLKEILEGPLPEISDAAEAARNGIKLYEEKFGPIPDSDSAEDVLAKLKRVIKINVLDEEVLGQLAYIYERRDIEPEEAEIVELAPIQPQPTQPERKSQKAREKIFQAQKPVEPPKQKEIIQKPTQREQSIPYVREMPPMGYLPATPSEKEVEDFRLYIKKGLEKSKESPRSKMNQRVYDLLNKYPPDQDDYILLSDELLKESQQAARAENPTFSLKPPNPVSPEMQILKTFNLAREMVQKHFINYEERQLKILQNNLAAIHTLRDRVQSDINIENALHQEIEKLKKEENQLNDTQTVVEEPIPESPTLIESQNPNMVSNSGLTSNNDLLKPALPKKNQFQNELILEIQKRINREKKFISEIAHVRKGAQLSKVPEPKISLDVTAQYNRIIERYTKQISAANLEINNSIKMILASKIPVHDVIDLLDHEKKVKQELYAELEKIKLHIKEITERNKKLQRAISTSEPEIEMPKEDIGSEDYDLPPMETNPPDAPPLVEDVIAPKVSRTQISPKISNMNFFNSEIAEKIKARRKEIISSETESEGIEESQQEELMQSGMEMVRLAKDQGIQHWEKTPVRFTPLKQKSKDEIPQPKTGFVTSSEEVSESETQSQSELTPGAKPSKD